MTIFGRLFSYGIPMPGPLRPISILYAVVGKYAPPAAGKPVETDQGRVRSQSTDDRAKCTDRKEQPMLDVILIAGGIGFFILSIAYAYGCDRL